MLTNGNYIELYLRSNAIESVVITLFLLYVTCLLMLDIQHYRSNQIRRQRHVPPPKADALIVHATCELVTEKNVDKVIRSNVQDYDTTTLQWISIYSTPLSAPFKSSSPIIRSYLQRQLFPVDYHAFIVFVTSDGMWWGIDKIKEGIFVSWGTSRDSVLFYFNRKPRATPVNLIAQDISPFSIGKIVKFLTCVILPENYYDPIRSNCQHFTKAIFDKFAEMNIWNLTTPTDMTSPLTLFSDGGYPFQMLSNNASFIYELYLLLNEGIGNDSSSYYYQYLLGILIIVLPIMLYSNYKADEEIIGILRVLIFYMLVFVLIVEGIFYTPLGTVRRRGAQYGKMWNSGHIIYRFWLPLSFAMFYGFYTYSCLLIIILWPLLVPCKFIHPYIYSCIDNLAIWLDGLRGTAFTAIWYVATVIYFSLLQLE